MPCPGTNLEFCPQPTALESRVWDLYVELHRNDRTAAHSYLGIPPDEKQVLTAQILANKHNASENDGGAGNIALNPELP